MHRKFRFIGQRLFNDAHAENPKETKDGWHVLRVNHDVAVLLNVQVTTGPGRRQKKEWKHVWRLGNIVGLRRLKSNPSSTATEAQLRAADVLVMNPKEHSGPSCCVFCALVS